MENRGFCSLFGVASLIGYCTGKVLGILVKSSHCHDCKTWKNKLNSAEYAAWYEEHVDSGNCKANHDGPSRNMEVSAIIKMFQRSVQNLEVKYRNNIGESDSKTYSSVDIAKPYSEDFVICKKECIMHVQRRMGTRVRELVNKT